MIVIKIQYGWNNLIFFLQNYYSSNVDKGFLLQNIVSQEFQGYEKINPTFNYHFKFRQKFEIYYRYKDQKRIINLSLDQLLSKKSPLI